jgi:tetratricopeptide (TPR) repeat protein
MAAKRSRRLASRTLAAALLIAAGLFARTAAADRNPVRDAALAAGDAAWQGRAAGAGEDGRARTAPIARAIAAYERAKAADPQSLAARWKLVRSLWFAADYADAAPEIEIRHLDRATRESEDALDALAGRLGLSGTLDSFEPALLAARLAPRDVEDAAGTLFWSAVAWGAWSQRHGRVEAVRAGVAARLYRAAGAVIALDPTFEEGGAHRMLARIHAEVPRIPFVSPFVDPERAVPAAERAFEIGPEHLGNRYLLALTILDVAPERRAEALRLLSAAAQADPRADQLVEDRAIRKAAHERLDRERGGERKLAAEISAGGT